MKFKFSVSLIACSLVTSVSLLAVEELVTPSLDSPSTNSLLAQNGGSAPDSPITGLQAPAPHVFLSADWLYWKGHQDGLVFLNASKQVEFDFQSGFRVGAGVYFPASDGWKLGANYTRFVPTGTFSTHGLEWFLYPLPSDGLISRDPRVQGSWKMEFQTADLVLGKAYYPTRTLILNPFFGIKGAWIDQRVHFHREILTSSPLFAPFTSTLETHFRNDFKGVGPLLGTGINWQLGAGFGLFADMASALVVGQFNNKQHQHHDFIIHKDVDLDTRFYGISPMVQAITGISWGQNFNRDRAHFRLSCGFETQYWWNQNQTKQFIDSDVPTPGRQKGDLALYGLTLRAGVDF